VSSVLPRPRRLPRTLVLALLVAATLATPAMAGAAQLSGSVTAHTGSPLGLAGTAVHVARSVDGLAMGDTTTGLDGGYAISLADGSYDVTFSPPPATGLSAFTTTEEHVSGQHTLNVTLEPAGTSAFRGVVRGIGGVALPNMTVRVGTTTVTSGADGSFSVLVAAGTYGLEVSGYRQSVAPEAVPYYVSMTGTIDLGVSRHQDLVLALHALTVRAVDGGGDGVADAVVGGGSQYLSGPIAGDFGPGTSASTAQIYMYLPLGTTDATGTAVVPIANFTSGRTETNVTPPAASNLPSANLDVGGVDVDQTRSVTLAGGSAFAGVVRGLDDVPLAGMMVRVGSTTVTSGLDGSFSMVVAAGTHALEVSGYRQGAASTVVPYHVSLQGTIDLASSREQDLVLPLHALTVHAVDGAGDPVSAAVVGGGGQSLSGPITGSFGPGTTASSAQIEMTEPLAVTDVAGAAVVPMVQFASATPTNVTPPVASGLASASLDVSGIDGDESRSVTLAGGSTFSGVVRGAGGVALAGMTVRVGPATVTSGADGSFALVVVPGTHALEVSGYRQGVAASVVPFFVAMQGTIDLASSRSQDLVLPLRTLTVKVLGPSGSPIAGSLVGGSNQYVEGAISGTLGPGTSVSAAQVFMFTPLGTTGATGTVAIPLPNFTSPSLRTNVTPPAVTTLPTAELGLAGIDHDQTRIVVLQHSIDDTAAPMVSCDAADHVWHADQVTLNCAASDPATGLARPADAAFTLSTHVAGGHEDADAHSDSRRVCDRADNCLVAGDVAGNMVDRLAPRIAITPGDPDGDGGWFRAGPATATVHVSDASPATLACTVDGDAIATTTITDADGLHASVSIGEDGDHALACTATDGADHDASATAALKRDGTTPTVQIVAPAGDPTIVAGASLPARYGCSDGAHGSGVASCSGDVADGADLDAAQLGAHVLHVSARDAAGNIASATAGYGVRERDSTPPVVEPTVTGTLGGGGWYTSDVHLRWSVADPQTPVDSQSGCASVDVTSDQDATTHACAATSEGGTTSRTVSIKRDAHAPVVAVTGVTDGGTYEAASVPAAACSTVDPGSGVASAATLSSTRGPTGSITVTCAHGRDNAGNEAPAVSATYAVHVTFAGEIAADDPGWWWHLGEGAGSAMTAAAGGRGGGYQNGVVLGQPGAIASAGGTAAQFNGTAAYAYANGVAAPAQAYTMEIWMKAAAPLKDGTLIDQGGAGALFIKTDRFCLRQTQTNVCWSQAPVAGRWYHVAGTWDAVSKTARLYVDGAERAAAPAPTAPSGSGTLYIGYGQSASWFKGLLDEPLYYRTALTAARIAAHYHAACDC
jgi:hypothetical protein